MENTEITNKADEVTPAKPVFLQYSIAILVCGIVSIVVLCYFGWIMSIVSLVLFNKAKKLYDENPSKYNPSSFNMAKSGRTCAIIGLVLSIAATIFWIFYIVIIVYALGISGHSNF
jgi:hypothetical protein